MKIIERIKALLAEAFELDNPEDYATTEFIPSSGWQAIFQTRLTSADPSADRPLTNGTYTSFPVVGFDVIYAEGEAVEASGMVFQDPPHLFAADTHPDFVGYLAPGQTLDEWLICGARQKLLQWEQNNANGN